MNSSVPLCACLMGVYVPWVASPQQQRGVGVRGLARLFQGESHSGQLTLHSHPGSQAWAATAAEMTPLCGCLPRPVLLPPFLPGSLVQLLPCPRSPSHCFWGLHLGWRSAHFCLILRRGPFCGLRPGPACSPSQAGLPFHLLSSLFLSVKQEAATRISERSH